MTNREAGVATAWLVLMAPVLAFPALAGQANFEVVAGLAIATFVGSVIVARHFGLLAWLVGFFAVMVVSGWLRSPGPVESLNHFSGIALGVFTMCTLAAWARTRGRLAFAAAAFLVVGVLALGLGFRSTPAAHKGKTLMGDTKAVPPPIVPLPLRELHANVVVNQNALSALAMMVLPVAAAIAIVPARSIAWPAGLRVLGGASALWAAAIIVLMQSRSAWLAAIVVSWLWMRTWLGPRLWRIVTVVLFLVAALGFSLLRGHPRGTEVVTTLVCRLNIWIDAAEAFKTSPWLGIGLDYFRNSGYSMRLSPPDQMVGTPHAHNIFFQTALDLGLIGLTAYLALQGFLARRALEIARKVRAGDWVKSLGTGAAASVVAVHAYGLLDAVSLGTKVGLFQWIASGLLLAAWRVDKREAA